MYSIILSLLIAFLVVLAGMPSTINLLRMKGRFGIDVHKLDRPQIPKGAGYLLLFAIVFSLLVVIGISTFYEYGVVDPGLLAALVSILMAGMIGLLDDVLDFSNRTKVILPLIASIPMIAMNVGTTTMNVPFIGTLNLGLVYPFVVVPLMMTFIIDATNMYAGMNGLETGLASVNASAIILYVLLSPFFNGEGFTTGQMDAATVAAALLGSALAFLIFNRYPAKVLTGDVGLLPIGATLAAALILGNMDRLAIILYVPFGLNFILYIIYRLHIRRNGMEYVKFANPRDDGSLEVVGPYTMYWILPHFARVTEKRNVAILVMIQAIIAYGGLILLLLII